MTTIAHLIIGPAEHGVVRHAELIAQACGHETIRVTALSGVPALDVYDVVHVPFTDRLFSPELDGAASAFNRLADQIAAAGAGLSVTLHDVPHGAGPLQRRRRELYRQVVSRARGVVVNSRVELSLIEPLAGGAHSLRLALLPVEELPARLAVSSAPATRQVTVFGFVYPDRGYEDVIAALPPDCALLAVGRAAEGHEDLPARYASLAGGRWALTGYLSDEQVSAHLWGAGVPVAPNQRVTASASINSWLAHGRRPLVPDSPYARELAVSRPGALSIYNPDDPVGLRRALEAALADPRMTWLAQGVNRGPAVTEVAAIYQGHLAACAPPAPLTTSSGAVVVPGNRWDLLAAHPPRPPYAVSVVIPYYEAQVQLDRVLAALAQQTYPAGRLEVIVADDGSGSPPDVSAAAGLRTRLVRQEDHGFRAAAARNLGVRAAEGDVLVFLDGDTTPEPGFIAAISRLPALCPDVIAVGRRRHACLTGPGAGAVLPEPEWLSDAYRRSADLLHADARSYRYVISAVLSMNHLLFDELRGFDERFVGYGGEDWELAHRGYVAGAVLAHVRGAVAWHDGPHWEQREPAHQPGAKNAETAILSVLLPDPRARGSGSWFPYPSIVVTIASVADDELMAMARLAFSAGVDCGLWAGEVTGRHSDLVLADPRLHRGEPPAEVLNRAQYQAQLHAPADLRELPDLCELAGRHGRIDTPLVTVMATRALRRSRRWAAGSAAEDLAVVLFGRQDRTGPPRLRDLDLAALLDAL